jgi:hypothetical protein
MASKKEIFDSAMEICTKHKVAAKFVAELTDLLEPKSGGASIDLSTVTKVDGNGNVTHIQCSLSDVWLPANSEFFYDDKSGKGIQGTDGSMLKRVSKQGEAIRKQYQKSIAASEKAIMTDVLNGDIKPEEGKAKLEEIKAVKADYSTITATTVTPVEAE